MFSAHVYRYNSQFQQLLCFTFILFSQYILLEGADDDEDDDDENDDKKTRNKEGSPDEATLPVEVLQLTVRGMHFLPSRSHWCSKKPKKDENQQNHQTEN